MTVNYAIVPLAVTVGWMGIVGIERMKPKKSEEIASDSVEIVCKDKDVTNKGKSIIAKAVAQALEDSFPHLKKLDKEPS